MRARNEVTVAHQRNMEPRRVADAIEPLRVIGGDDEPDRDGVGGLGGRPHNGGGGEQQRGKGEARAHASNVRMGMRPRLSNARSSFVDHLST